MLLRGVTITGIDCHTSLTEVVSLARRHPFSEFGLLVSESAAGKKMRYMDFELVKFAQKLFAKHDVNYAIHVCGKLSKDLLAGDGRVFDMLEPVSGRVQINANIKHIKKVDIPALALSLNKHLAGRQVIVQQNNAESLQFFKLLDAETKKLELKGGPEVVTLFDASGGRGLLINSFPRPYDNYCGYAGGLCPENVEDTILKLEAMEPADKCFYIDMESGVRTDDILDLNKVEEVLETASKFITG